MRTAGERDRADTGALDRGSREEVTEETEKKTNEESRRSKRVRWWGRRWPRRTDISSQSDDCVWYLDSIEKQQCVCVYKGVISQFLSLSVLQLQFEWLVQICPNGCFNFNSALTALGAATTSCPPNLIGGTCWGWTQPDRRLCKHYSGLKKHLSSLHVFTEKIFRT